MIQTQEKQIVLKAIDELGRSVTPADVATKTGLPILKATAELNQIASETRGHLEVATTGDIAYKFDPGFQNAYLAKGVEKALQDFVGSLLKISFFLLRISFGVMLIVTFVLVIVLIIAAIIAMMTLNSQRDSGDRGDFDFSFDFFDFMILRDLLWWGSYASYSGSSGYSDWGNYSGSKSTYIDYDRPTTRSTPKSNFFYNVFSFLFGDGNPNLNLEERKWQYIAQLIKEMNGVVTAEQLAPYTGADPKNEDGVLPVLVRFNGTPQVTEAGNIIYQFPDLQVTTGHAALGKLPKYLREFHWEFTSATGEQLIPVYILAFVNLFGGWWLLFHRLVFPVALTPLILVLAGYGTFFLIVPALRYLILQHLNKRIEVRNDTRSLYNAKVQTPSKELVAKLGEARELKIKEKQLTTQDIVYRTDKDALEQEFDASP